MFVLMFLFACLFSLNMEKFFNYQSILVFLCKRARQASALCLSKAGQSEDKFRTRMVATDFGKGNEILP